jgi:hypothetical protein
VNINRMEKLNKNFFNPHRKELIGWFERNAPSLGELYQGAIFLLCDESFPGRSRLIAHAVREIKNRLPDAISGEQHQSNLEYVKRLDKIAEVWKKEKLPIFDIFPISGSVENPPTSPDFSIPAQIFLMISKLIKEHIETREKSIEKAFKLFVIIAPENQEEMDSIYPIVLKWKRITDWFVRQCHKWETFEKDINHKELNDNFEIFETILLSLVRSFFKTTEDLDELLEETNNRTS